MGTVVENAGSRLGIWLLPDNRSPGKLEDFLALLVPPDDRCLLLWATQSEHVSSLACLTYAVNPAASVSGLYLAHPEAKYFALGEIGRDRTGSGGELCEAEGDGGGGGGAVVGAQPRVLSQIFAATKIDGPALHLG